jgi:hypothetical protein
METPSVPPTRPEGALAQELQQQQPELQQPRDAAYWAAVVSTLKATDVPADAVLLNVNGRRVVGPLQGFGQMWQKTYWVHLLGASATPAVIIKTWKQEFPTFWPRGNRFYAPLTGIAPGEVAALTLRMPGAIKLSTGVLVLYADDESFTLMTPQGHVLAGWITFSAYEEDGVPIAKAQLLIRGNDPLYEIGLRLGGHRQEDKFWEHTLTALATRFGVRAPVERQVVCLDPRLQWSQAGNIWQNAAVRTLLYTLTTPLRALYRRPQR